MTKHIYGAVLRKSEDGGWWAEVPDLPGCFGQGDTFMGAVESISNGLETHLAAMAEHGMPAPEAAPVTTDNGEVVYVCADVNASERPDTDSFCPGGPSVLYLFFDESGNFDFSENGTSYFIMTCLVARRPFTVCHELMDAKYDIFEAGTRAKKFHATSDKDHVKSKVYEIIERHSRELAAYAVFVEKKNIPDSLKSADALYFQMFKWLVDTVYANEAAPDIEKIIAITDDLPKDAKRRQVDKPLKKFLAACSERYGVRSFLEHFPSESDFNLQVADYLCWAFMRMETRAGDWPWTKVSEIFKQTLRIRK